MFLPLVGCFPAPTPPNETPIITSTPITTATIGVLYAYDVNATDPDGDTLTYSLITRPTGMTINSANGLIIWIPVAAQIGNNSVTVKVSDGSLSIIQSFTIKVSTLPVINQAPIIYSTPITTATVGVTYFYDVEATDPDGDTLTYSLTTYPPGMTISSASGLIMWTPVAKGNYAVVVKVSDGVLSDTQGFTIIVSAVEPGLIGIKVSPKTMTLLEGESKTITSVTAHYSDGSTAGIALGSCTYVSSATTVAKVSNGVITAFAKGTATIIINYKGKTDALQVMVSALPPANQAPVIYSIPNLMAIVGVAFTYEVEAFDPDGDVLTYSLTDRPKGMEIESNTGVISWIPTSIQVGHNVVIVSVSDGNLSDTKYFAIWVDPVKLIGIEVDPEAMDLFVKEQRYITKITAHYNNEYTAPIAPGDCIYVSDSGVAKVDFNGLITAVAEGKATITVTYRPNGMTFRDTVKVTVKRVLEVVQDSGQNDINKESNHPYINWTIDGLCIEFEFVNPTPHSFVFDYRVDGEEGESNECSDILIEEGELDGEEIGLSYNWVVLDNRLDYGGIYPEPMIATVQVCAEEEVWVGMRVGAEQNWYLDWIKFEVRQ